MGHLCSGNQNKQNKCGYCTQGIIVLLSPGGGRSRAGQDKRESRAESRWTSSPARRLPRTRLIQAAPATHARSAGRHLSAPPVPARSAGRELTACASHRAGRMHSPRHGPAPATRSCRTLACVALCIGLPLAALAASSPHRPQRRPRVFAAPSTPDARSPRINCHCSLRERSKLFRAYSFCHGSPCHATPPSPAAPLLLRRASPSSHAAPELQRSSSSSSRATPAVCCSGGSRSRSWY